MRSIRQRWIESKATANQLAAEKLVERARASRADNSPFIYALATGKAQLAALLDQGWQILSVDYTERGAWVHRWYVYKYEPPYIDDSVPSE